MDSQQMSWVAGSMPLGAAFAAIPIPFLVDSIGRKKTLLCVVPPYVFGFALLAWAQNVSGTGTWLDCLIIIIIIILVYLIISVFHSNFLTWAPQEPRAIRR